MPLPCHTEAVQFREQQEEDTEDNITVMTYACDWECEENSKVLHVEIFNP